MWLKRRDTLALGLGALASTCGLPALAQKPPLVFAAASLKTVLDRISAEVIPMRLAYGGSGALARQILQGAPADLFLSANSGWMDAVAEAGQLQPHGRIDLLGNRLVLIAGLDQPEIALETWRPAGRIATGFVDAVPVGQYAKAAFEKLGLWQTIEPFIVETASVTAAVAYVAQGALPYGVVYVTDALAEPRVRIIARFGPELHPPIIYPLGLLTEEGGAVHAALRGDQAAGLFADAGFEVL